ncbi:hypothetical protein [Tellurirhabdus bombi]|uniref:hypothetical protein n=1 Tax=Tellurirhabdus bombi TaxID=2907205 RepID=UPI001F419AD0|nr:hypothetical protein [Tellurirhabdus bombi]
MQTAIASFVSLNLPEVKSYVHKADGGMMTQNRTVRLDWEHKFDMYQSDWLNDLLAKYGEIIQNRLKLTDDEISKFEILGPVLRSELEYVFSGAGETALSLVLERMFEYASIQVAKGNPDPEKAYTA